MSTQRDRRAAYSNLLAQGATLLATPPIADARYLPLDRIDPNPTQARQVFDEERLGELAASIREHGVLEPILVRTVGDRYQVVAGERRTRAARMAGLRTIPAISRDDLSDADAAAITAVENLQREDLSIADEGRQYQTLMTVWAVPSQRALAERLGVSHNRISRALRLLPYPGLTAQVDRGELTLNMALRAVAQAPEDVGQPALLAEEPTLVERPELDADPPPVYHGDTPSGDMSPPAPADPAPAATWRPLYQASRALFRMAQTVTPASVNSLPPAERAKLRDELEAVEANLSTLRELVDGEDD